MRINESEYMRRDNFYQLIVESYELMGSITNMKIGELRS
jgi:hypothetical protein